MNQLIQIWQQIKNNQILTNIGPLIVFLILYRILNRIRKPKIVYSDGNLLDKIVENYKSKEERKKNKKFEKKLKILSRVIGSDVLQQFFVEKGDQYIVLKNKNYNDILVCIDYFGGVRKTAKFAMDNDWFYYSFGYILTRAKKDGTDAKSST